MKCPYCGIDMEKGYIDQTDFRFPLEWYPANRVSGIFDNKKRNIKLTSVINGGTIKVYHCAECRKLIIDQENM